MDFLRLLGRRNFARPDGPDWLIRNNDPFPEGEVALQLLCYSIQLARHNSDGLAALSLGKALTTAENHPNAALERNFAFRCDERIILLQDDATFRVPKDCPGDVGVLEL